MPDLSESDVVDETCGGGQHRNAGPLFPSGDVLFDGLQSIAVNKFNVLDLES